jgi:methionine-rich copper-binding protein CopC
VVSPADGSLVAEMPQEVRIRFTEGVELEFSRIQVKDPSGKVVSQGTIRRLAADTLAVDLKAGGAGHYTIEWQVLSVDTHVTEGTLRFTVSGQGK